MGRYVNVTRRTGWRVPRAGFCPTDQQVAGLSDRVEAIVEADARDLGGWADGSFDAVVCLGPFYHLPDADDRARAAGELRRVLVPDGVAFVALMPALAFARRSLALPDERRHLCEPGFIERVLQQGVFFNDVPGRFTHGDGVGPDEVPPFFAGFGFEQLALLSAESVTVGLELALPEVLVDERLTQVALDLAIRHAGDPSILGLARHLLYVGRRVTEANRCPRACAPAGEDPLRSSSAPPR